MKIGELEFTEREIKELENMTILRLGQEIEHAIEYSLVHENVNVIKFLKMVVYRSEV